MNGHIQFLDGHSSAEIDKQMDEPPVGCKSNLAQFDRLAEGIDGIDQRRLDWVPIVESAIYDDQWG